MIAVAVLALATPSNAIIMRNDVDQNGYLALGHEHRAVTVQLGLEARTGGAMLFNGMGTLIAPDWVLTAAHAVGPIRDTLAAGRPHYVFLKGRAYRVAAVHAHPGFTEDAASATHDIALLRLEQPVRNPRPACLYERSDEMGKVVVLVGAGVQGDGMTGPNGSDPDGGLRGATSTVSGVRADQIEWVFRSPADADVTALEGISGPGDSGGPALIDIGGGYCVAGVSSFQRNVRNPDDPTTAALPEEGHYGVVEVYARVSHYLPWIRATMAGG
jgi:secreted trypsin-like serine protease